MYINVFICILFQFLKIRLELYNVIEILRLGDISQGHFLRRFAWSYVNIYYEFLLSIPWSRWHKNEIFYT